MFDYTFEKRMTLSGSKKSAIDKTDYARDVSNNPKPKAGKGVQYSVIIVAYNEKEDLVNLLASVKKQSIGSNKYEIILVDNGLDAETKKIIDADPLVTYIKARANLGPSHGRNIGSVYASGDWLVFLDADADIETVLLKNFEAFTKNHPDAIVVRGKVISRKNGKGFHRSPRHYDLGNTTVNHYPTTEGISFWNKKLFQKSGGFEEELYGGEGIVLAYRMHQFYNTSIDAFYYCPNLVLYHDYNKNTQQLLEKVKRTEIAKKQIDIRYPLLREFLQSFKKYSDINPGYRKPRNHRQTSRLLAQAEHKARQEFDDYVDDIMSLRLKERTSHNKESIKFSVIVPHYNLGKTVVEAVNSVLRQSLDDIEVIVVDDKSSDAESLEYLKGLEDLVKVIYQKRNTGVSGARNTGVKSARGKYILCLDADDTIEPEYLEQAYNLFEDMPDDVGIVSTWAKFFGGRNELWRPKQDIGFPDALVDSPLPTASCFKKKAWEDAGGYFEDMRGYEDWHLWVSILSNNWKVKVIPYPNFNYFVRPNSKVNTSNNNAQELVGHIVNNNREAYIKHLEYIIGKKHYQIVKLRYKVRAINRNRSRNLLLLIPRFFIKFIRLSLAALKDIAKAFLVSRDPKKGYLIVKKKAGSFLSGVKRTLNP